MGSTSAGGIEVATASRVDDELVAAFNRLMPQLSQSAPLPTPDLIREIVEAQASTVLVARDCRDDGRIVGMLTLVVFRIPTGVRAWIEDVVVDEAVRGRGVGEALSQEAVRRAIGLGARTVELTSRPSREAANRLYQRLGFVRRDSNVYRYTPWTVGWLTARSTGPLARIRSPRPVNVNVRRLGRGYEADRSSTRTCGG